MRGKCDELGNAMFWGLFKTYRALALPSINEWACIASDDFASILREEGLIGAGEGIGDLD